VEVIAKKGAKLPLYASDGAAGADVFAYLEESILLLPGKMALVPTGLFFAIPVGFEIQVRPRSGLAFKHQLTVLNSPGTIDSDYRGELKVLLINLGGEPFIVEPDMRIAQIVLAPVVRGEFTEVEVLSETVRGEMGFGHTGLR
jgi:dUTP pyrophosphatase